MDTASVAPDLPALLHAASLCDLSGKVVLCLSNCKGNFLELNRLAKETNAALVVHCGDFGFGSQGDLLPEITEFLEGKKSFSIPVCVVWSEPENIEIVTKIKSGELRIPNLHIINENKHFTFSFTSNDFCRRIRIFSFTGSTIPPINSLGISPASSPTSSPPVTKPVQKAQDAKACASLFQIGQLIKQAGEDTTDQIRIVVVSPTHQQEVVAQWADKLRADFVIAPATLNNGPVWYNPYTLDAETFTSKKKLLATAIARWCALRQTDFESMFPTTVNQPDHSEFLEDTMRVWTSTDQKESESTNCQYFILPDASRGNMVLNLTKEGVDAQLGCNGLCMSKQNFNPPPAKTENLVPIEIDSELTGWRAPTSLSTVSNVSLINSDTIRLPSDTVSTGLTIKRPPSALQISPTPAEWAAASAAVGIKFPEQNSTHWESSTTQNGWQQQLIPTPTRRTHSATPSLTLSLADQSQWDVIAQQALNAAQTQLSNQVGWDNCNIQGLQGTLSLPGANQSPQHPWESRSTHSDSSKEGNTEGMTVWVGNLPENVTDDDVRVFFRGISLLRIKLSAKRADKRPCAYVDLPDADCLEKALRLSGERLNGSRLKVEYDPSRLKSQIRKDRSKLNPTEEIQPQLHTWNTNTPEATQTAANLSKSGTVWERASGTSTTVASVPPRFTGQAAQQYPSLPGMKFETNPPKATENQGKTNSTGLTTTWDSPPRKDDSSFNSGAEWDRPASEIQTVVGAGWGETESMGTGKSRSTSIGSTSSWGGNNQGNWAQQTAWKLTPIQQHAHLQPHRGINRAQSSDAIGQGVTLKPAWHQNSLTPNSSALEGGDWDGSTPVWRMQEHQSLQSQLLPRMVRRAKSQMLTGFQQENVGKANWGVESENEGLGSGLGGTWNNKQQQQSWGENMEFNGGYGGMHKMIARKSSLGNMSLPTSRSVSGASVNGSIPWNAPPSFAHVHSLDLGSQLPLPGVQSASGSSAVGSNWGGLVGQQKTLGNWQQQKQMDENWNNDGLDQRAASGGMVGASFGGAGWNQWK